MTVKDLKELLNNYHDDLDVTVLLSMGTVYRINHCNLDCSKHDPDLYNIVGKYDDDNDLKTVILTLE